MCGDGFEQATILRTGPDGLTRVIVRYSLNERESLVVDTREAELLLFRRCQDFHATRSDSRVAGACMRANTLDHGASG
jgi:hypothetical protein